MNLKYLFIAVPASLYILGTSPAIGGQTLDDVGYMACVNDKWDETEP